MGNEHPELRRYRKHKGEEYNCRLIRAVNRQDLEMVRYLLQKQFLDLEEVEKGHTALTLAIAKRNLDLINMLIHAGARVTCGGGGGGEYLFPLKEAIQSQWPDSVKCLLESGTNVNFVHQSFDGGSIEFLKAAVAQSGTGVSNWRTMGQGCVGSEAAWHPVPPRCIKILDLLIQAGADYQACDPKQRNILHFCCEHNHYMAAQHLLTTADWGAGQAVNTTSLSGETPIMEALSRGHEEVACLLLQHSGCDLHTENQAGQSLLTQAALRNATDFVKMLLSMGFNINKKRQSTGNTALFDVLSAQNVPAARMLLDSGADVNAVNNEGQTPLYVTVRRNDLTLFNLLIDEYRAECDVSDNKGRNLLHTAAHFGHQRIAEALLHRLSGQQSDYVNGVDIAHKTALYIAVCTGHQTIVEALLEAGAEVNIVDQFGISPLYQAVMMGRTLVIEVLLNAGAAVDLYNHKGRGPLHAAIAYPKLDIAALTLLLNARADPITLDSFLDFLVESGVFQPTDLLDDKVMRMLKSQPKPLKHWCRWVIRANLPEQKQYGALKRAIDTLEIPNLLKLYLGVQFL